jgi:glyoxylase-like metal-dependent hydrolase (beta-lactamase superfamily II)
MQNSKCLVWRHERLAQRGQPRVAEATPTRRLRRADTGMDLVTHRFFGRGAEEPYFPEAEARVASALQKAKAIIVTHEHGDHIAGLIKSPSFNELAPKAVLTRAQLETLVNEPQMPELKATPEMAARLHVIDYADAMAFAPALC